MMATAIILSFLVYSKYFVMRNLFFTILLLLPLFVISQSPQIEPSWDLMPSDGPTNEDETSPVRIVESNNGCYFVSLWSDTMPKIIKFDNDGEILQQIILQNDENTIYSSLTLDKHNDTINVFIMNLVKDNEYSVLIFKHAYLYDDMSMSEQNEIWRKVFEGEIGDNINSASNCIIEMPALIDAEGNRIFFFQALSQNTINVILKFDSKFNIVSEKIYDNEDLGNGLVGIHLMYNADSTQYYMVSYRNDYPYYYFMNVFDIDFNLVEQIPFESNPPVHLQSFVGDWCRNPYDGRIYAFGLVNNPNIKSEIGVFKIDIDNDDVDFLRLSYSNENITNNVNIGNNLCFLPDGKIIGCAIYDVEPFWGYKPDAYYAYIPVFDTNMKKISEWYYSIGYEYNQFLHRIHLTKDNGVILIGDIRFMMDDEIYWEPYIVKFPASAFDTDNIEEAHAHGLKAAIAYPNPGGDVMNIRTALRNTTLLVYDMQGRKVYEQEITDDVTSIDASKWESGTYVWKLGTVNGNEVEGKILESGKWVKE